MKKAGHFVRRVLSKTKADKSEAMSDVPTGEIEALKVQIDNLKAAIRTLQSDSHRKEVAVANIAREKEKVTVDYLRQRRSNERLSKQLDEERAFYYKEKEVYCQEMNQYKKLRRQLSNASVDPLKNEIILEQQKKEIDTLKKTLNQTLEANYNLSIKFLRMKNTKTCLKTELKTMQLEHEKLINDYKSKILQLQQELDELVQARLSTPMSCSNRKYLNLVKQNSCLTYENLCLQLEVDNMRIKYEKLRLNMTKNQSNSKLQYIKHEQPEKLASTSKVPVEKIYERNSLPGVPEIKLTSDFNSLSRQSSVQSGLVRVRSSPEISKGYK